MKKIGIVTLFGNYNYGNRLQNYAVQQIAKKYGYESETLIFVMDGIKEKLRGIKRSIQYLQGKPEMKRYHVFNRFKKELIPTRTIIVNNGNVNPDLKKEYDFFFVGSDQVWNPDIRQNQREIFFLSFADKRQRVCIAPSIGVSSIEDVYEATYRQGLQGFEHLCCREEEGRREIERISLKECLRLIDPTMAIDADEWRLFSENKHKEKKGGFVFCFFLGIIPSQLRKRIMDFAEKENLKIIMPSDKESCYYECDPRDFVDYIDCASVVFTDSFHVAAFSINLETPFWVFNRCDNQTVTTRISSRIQTLTELFKVSDRYIDDENYNVDFSAECSFSEARVILEDEKKKLYSYVEKCIAVNSHTNE